MRYEVEQKFRCADLEQFAARLRALGAVFGPPERQVDGYYRHPARDFRQTDEALRVRRVGDKVCFTYKGPRIDAATKTRREIELPLADESAHAATDQAVGKGAGQAMAAAASESAPASTGGVHELACEFLEALGFAPLRQVGKTRQTAELAWQGWSAQVALDRVDDLGDFVELELMASPEQLEAAKAAVLSLAERLELVESERRGYLSLLLERDGAEKS